jgi:Na+-transporting NADH:ubiquinone oxidoreductase subunit C
MPGDSVKKVLFVAFSLCVVCSILVSTSAVKLRPIQEANKRLDLKKNLLLATGLVDSNASSEEIKSVFTSKIETLVVDVKTGMKVSNMDATSFDQRKAAGNPKLNEVISSDIDIAKIKYRSKYSLVYLVKENGNVDQIVLPIKGKGLWSTLYGFLALGTDTKTIKGIGFYEHGETAGLGGEIDNPKWKALWVGKTGLDSNFDPVIEVVKGMVNPSSPQKHAQVDGLSGATITSRGVGNLVKYWLSKNGHGPFLEKFRQGNYL